ncbi:class F sortase [Candidatus Saccharibacteria bacterium]|nr:class F sortase [Candidatus Saccharibacteria bacterium]
MAQTEKSSQGKSPRNRSRLKLVLILISLGAGLAAGYFLVDHLNLFNLRDIRLERIRNEQVGIDENAPDKSGSPDCKAAPDDPRFLTIEAIGINQACVVPIGVLSPDENGSQQLDAPKNYHDVGWYNCQINPVASNRCSQPTRPGDGDTAIAAVLDGHSCTGNNCIFDNVTKLKNGDQIVVERGDGKKIEYTVKEVSVVKLADVDMAKMMRPIVSGVEGLNLITCAGNWTARDSQGVVTMDKRVMVFAARNES